MWELEYSRAARNYALDSHPYNEDVLIAIELLAQSPSGIPQADYTESPPGEFLWEVAGHFVAFERVLFPRRKLRIVAIWPIA
jgi:hypothetical protein